MPETMTVTVMYRNNWFGGDGWKFYPVTVQIPAVCPVCGGPRGEPTWDRFRDTGEWYSVHKWTNPCGHVDKYKDILIEAGYKE